MSGVTGAEPGDRTLERVAALWSRRKWLALGIFLVVFVPAATLLWAIPSVYEASATLVPNDVAGAVPSGALAGNSPPSLDAVSEEVLSRANLMAIIDRLGLFPEERARETPDVLTTRMRRNIAVEPRQSGASGTPVPFAFTVAYRGTESKRAADVANTLAQSYQSVAEDMQNRDAAQAAKALETRLAVIQDKLARQQQKIDAFNSTHIGELPEQQQINLAALERADTQLRENQASQIQAMQRRADLLANADSTDRPRLPQLEQRLAALRMRYTDQYPDVQQLKAQISALKGQQTAGVDSGAAGATSPVSEQLREVDATLDDLKAQERRLRARVADYQRRLDELPITQQNLKTLTRGYSETDDVYTALLKRYEEARVAEQTASKDGPPFAILQSAVAPSQPSGPHRFRFLGMVFLLSWGLAGAVALLAERLDTSVHTLEELREFTAVPVLATVPYIRTRGETRRRRLRAAALALVFVFAAVLLGAGSYFAGHGNTSLAQVIPGQRR